jgi:hypothetical protein
MSKSAAAFACAAVLLILVLVVLGLQLGFAPIPKKTTNPPLPLNRLVLIGTGLSAACFVHYLSPPLRAAVDVREATPRFGGRVLSGQQAVQPVSTLLPMNEFGAWKYDHFKHGLTINFLYDLQVPVLPQVYMPAQSFVFFGGVRKPWPSPPVVPSGAEATPYASVDADTAQAWLAYTGIPQSEAGSASLQAVATAILPAQCGVPAGMGWTDVALRGFGQTFIQYGQKLDRISTAGEKQLIKLHYANGEEEEVGSLVLTCTPSQLLEIAGVLSDVKDTVQTALTSADQGVIYATWMGSNVWWPATGFQAAVAATDTILGSITVASPGVLRCSITGAAAVAHWTQAFVAPSQDAVKQEIVGLLATVFGVAAVPLPVAVSFRSWPQSLWLWTAGVDVVSTRAQLSRPCGMDMPVFWASGDLSDVQNRVEGCVQAGLAAAAIAPKLLN